MRTRLTLTTKEANAMMSASLEAARAAGRAVSIAIVDDAGVPVDFRRMDGARGYTVDLAMRKARASALVSVSTAMIEAMFRNRPASPEMAVGQGGLPAMANTDCVGGIGVSGAKPEEDEAIAQAGLAALPGP